MTARVRCALAALLFASLAGCGDELGPGRPPVQVLPGSDARLISVLDQGRIPATDGGYLPPKKDSSAQPKQDTQTAPPPPKKDQGAPPAPDSGGGVQLTAQEKDLLDAINSARAKAGLNTLVPDPLLMCAARLAAQVVPPTGSCGHVGADGSWPNDRAQKCGMNSTDAWKVNEIAAGPGFTDGADAVWGWSQSSGHWWGLTHPQAKKIGVAGTSSGCYWAVFDCCIKGS